jgi:hypothetical protein
VKIKVKNHRNNVAFDSTCGNRCPHAGACPVKPGRKYHYLRYDDKAMRSANRQTNEQTNEFKERLEPIVFEFLKLWHHRHVHATLN